MGISLESVRGQVRCGLAGAAALLLMVGGVAAEPVKLTFATGLPPASPLIGPVMQAWADKANEVGNGEYEIEVVNGFALANYSNMWDRVETGVIDIGVGLQGATGMPFDKSAVVSLPLVVTDPIVATKVLWGLYSEGTISDEYEGVRVLGLPALPVQGLSATKSITTLTDIEGMKIRAVDKVAADTVTALGAAPIYLPTTEVYQSLSRGVVDAAVVNWLMVGAFKVGEVAPYHQTAMPLGSIPSFVIMNESSFERLSPEGQAALNSVSGEYLSDLFASGYKDVADALQAGIADDSNQNIETLSDEEQAAWEEKLLPVIESWKSRTPDGAKVYEAFEAAVAAQ